MAPFAGLVLAAGLSTPSLAADLAAPAPAPVPAAFDSSWFSTVGHTLVVEGGIAINPDDPSNHRNTNQLFSDKANQPLLNEVLGTLSRPLDPAAKGYDVGFNLQGLYGSDSRDTPTYGLFNYQSTDRNQFSLLQADLLIHTPWLSDGGVDFKLGLNAGIMGYEALDPTIRPFYTYSYISNFVLPYTSTGLIATWHYNPTVDLIVGIDTGAGTTFGSQGDNNSVPAGYLGFTLNNLLNNKLTVTAITRLGPEDSLKVLPNANSQMRYWNDITAIYKATDKLTLVGEGNYLKDDGFNATTIAFAGYALYAFNDEVGVNFRGEVYRDNSGLFTYTPISNTVFTSFVAGNPDNFLSAPPTTYADVTAGVTLKPAVLSNKYVKVTIRPEVRYDRALSGSTPFDIGTKKDQVLLSGDIIFAF